MDLDERTTPGSTPNQPDTEGVPPPESPHVTLPEPPPSIPIAEDPTDIPPAPIQ